MIQGLRTTSLNYFNAMIKSAEATPKDVRRHRAALFLRSAKVSRLQDLCAVRTIHMNR